MPIGKTQKADGSIASLCVKNYYLLRWVDVPNKLQVPLQGTKMHNGI